jgi:hydroxymethylglutaryl-CoA reductase
MGVIAATGLANNFSALRSLVTRGIQQGHMRMHLSNMLLQYHLNPEQQARVKEYFRGREISYAAVKDYVSRHFPGIN